MQTASLDAWQRVSRRFLTTRGATFSIVFYSVIIIYGYVSVGVASSYFTDATRTPSRGDRTRTGEQRSDFVLVFSSIARAL